MRRLCCVDKNNLFSLSLIHTLSCFFFCFFFYFFLPQTSSILQPPNSTRTHSLSHRLKISLTFNSLSSMLQNNTLSPTSSNLPHHTSLLQHTTFKLAFQNQATTVREIKPKNRRIMVTQSPTLAQLLLSCIPPPLSLFSSCSVKKMQLIFLLFSGSDSNFDFLKRVLEALMTRTTGGRRG